MYRIRIVWPAQLAFDLSVSLTLALFVLFLILASPTLAQDVSTPTSEATQEATEEPPLIIDQPIDEPIVEVPEETPPVFTPAAPNDVFNGALLALFSLFASAIASPLTALIVSVLKRVPPFNVKNADGSYKISGDQVNLFVALLLSVISWTAASIGFAGQLDSIYRIIFLVLPVLTGAGGNFVANQAVYEFGKRKNIPVLEYARTTGNVQRNGIPSPYAAADV